MATHSSQHLLNHQKSKRVPEKHFCFIDYAKAFDCVDHNKPWKILKEMGIPDHLTCLLRNLYLASFSSGHTESVFVGLDFRGRSGWPAGGRCLGGRAGQMAGRLG